jgi:hypothetical protein
MLIFVSGSSLVTVAAAANSPLADIYTQSKLVRLMIDYTNLWFFLPGATLIGLSVLGKKSA